MITYDYIIWNNITFYFYKIYWDMIFFWGVTKRWIYAMIHCRKISRNGFAKSTTAESQALYHSALFVCLFIYFCHLAFGFVWLVRQGKNGCAILPASGPCQLEMFSPYIKIYYVPKMPPKRNLDSWFTIIVTLRDLRAHIMTANGGYHIWTTMSSSGWKTIYAKT